MRYNFLGFEGLRKKCHTQYKNEYAASHMTQELNCMYKFIHMTDNPEIHATKLTLYMLAIYDGRSKLYVETPHTYLAIIWSIHQSHHIYFKSDC